jgi:hypothetical protein
VRRIVNQQPREQIERIEEILREQNVDDRYTYEVFFDLADIIRRYEDLIKWFAAKWDDQNPEFPDVDPVTNQLLPGNVELSETWFMVVRGGERCPVCKGARYETAREVERGVVELTVCEHCEGRGFIKV